MPKKILLTGATGFIGRHLLESWQQQAYRVFATATNTAPLRSLVNADVHLYDLDVVDEMSTAIWMETIRPEVVVHTAAMSKPDACERDKQAAFETNVMATKNIAECCKKHHAHLIFLSTDMVFDHMRPSVETDAYSPVNYYGKTKMMAEEAIIESGCTYTILRIIFVYGKQLPMQRPSFLHWIKESLETGKEIFAYTDQQRNVLYAGDLCRVVNAIILGGNEGIYHVAGSEVCTPYSLALSVAQQLHLNDHLIKPVTAAERPETAKRAAVSLLNTGKAAQVLGFAPTALAVAMQEIF